MIASYHEADSEKDMSIKKEKITEIEEYLSKQNPKKNLSEEKNSDDSSMNSTIKLSLLISSN